jgi:acetyl-CoA carboxylase biotin carboxylase subunit
LFRKILIANRGEIALRIIWACKELGIKTVAVHSDVDIDSLHVRFADENVCIGPAPSRQSYLNINNLIAAAEISNADAIHPGYGFLAESEEFAQVCRACNITFIGPSPETIALMGNKAEAKRTMKAAGVPILPGSDGPVANAEEARVLAAEVGYPVILKASAGGGGKGMRVIRSEEEIENAFMMCATEARSAFGNGDLYLEKYLDAPRHIEFQLLGDLHGNVVHLNERECSIQRRHQKLIEEAPSLALSAELRAEMGEVAVRGCQAVNYATTGTIEFLYEGGKYYFMEMNTRIQVEHPVTENITGVDLVKSQIRVAAGEKLPFAQEDISIQGHSLECRINAEDPFRYTPSPGRITTFHVPGGPGVRVDTAAYAGYFVSPHYDSLVAKLIVRGKNRPEVIIRMKRALDSFVVEGIKTNVPMHLKIMDDPDFLAGNLSTRFMERYMNQPSS